MPITHAKVSAKSDGSDTSLIRPSDWNADHVGGDLRVTADISAGQIRTLFTVPVELIPTPGAGKFIVVKWVTAYYTFVTTPYDFFIPSMGIDSIDNSVETEFLTGNVGVSKTAWGAGAYAPSAANPTDKALILFSAQDPGSSGDGTLRYIIDYEIVTL